MAQNANISAHDFAGSIAKRSRSFLWLQWHAQQQQIATTASRKCVPEVTTFARALLILLSGTCYISYDCLTFTQERFSSEL